ncbi:MAG TPA: hypothetical protein VM942_02165 [Acidimicrobiales bacterium]|nr:hypothetical protein [Acidimicrobiales bacterium]
MADTDNDGRISRDDYLVFSEGITGMLASVGPDEGGPSSRASTAVRPHRRRLRRQLTQDEYAAWLSAIGLDADTDIDAAFAGFDKTTTASCHGTSSRVAAASSGPTPIRRSRRPLDGALIS